MKTHHRAKKDSVVHTLSFRMVLFLIALSQILLSQALSIAYADLSITRTQPSETSIKDPASTSSRRPAQSTKFNNEPMITSQLIKKIERLYNANLVSLNKINDNQYLARLITNRGKVIVLEINPDGDIIKVLDQ